MKWLEISIAVDGELAEPIAELFARHAPGGVAIEATRPETADEDPGLHVVKAYLPQDESLNAARKAIETGLWHLGQIQPLPPASFTALDAQDWEEAWRAKYQPIPIGNSLLILPPWFEQDEPGRHPLIIEPGMAFGTGTHPSTQLCLTLLETYLRPGEVVIDLGCGSGILSIAAARLGSSAVYALDIDPGSVEITLKNAERNGVASQIRAAHGSLEAIPDLLKGFEDASPPALLMANILAPILEDMLSGGLADYVHDGGLLILSGILVDQLPHLIEVAREQGLDSVEIRGQDDWRAVALRKTERP